MLALAVACASLLASPDAQGNGAEAAAAAKRHGYEQFALTHEGDSRRGRELFLDEKQTKCAVCHRVGGKGGDVGPDLTHVGGKFDRPHLIESLLEPSRQIVEGYRTTSIVTTDGRLWTGIVRDETGDALTLVEASGQRHRLVKASIEERHTGGVSLMPQGIAEVLSADQFTDLIAYLESLRGGEKPTPGQATSDHSNANGSTTSEGP